MSKKIINLKPTSHDIHYEYICPICGFNHWINSKEAATQNYKIVCDCDSILIPKPIENISIQYKNIDKKCADKSKNRQREESNDDSEGLDGINKSEIILDKELLVKTSKVLEQYGFETSEAENLIKTAFDISQETNIAELVRIALKQIGVNNEQFV